MTPNDQLTKLWELLDKGTHKAWPECIELFDEPGYRRCWLYLGNEPVAVSDDEHALAIARDHIEGWLESKFIHYSKSRRLGMDSYCTGTTTWDSLIDAVRYALGKEKE